MKIAIGNDHTAIELKSIIEEFMEGEGYEIIDLGTNSTESCGYPIYGEKVGRAVANGQVDLRIAVCSTGVGIFLAVNKVKGIRTCMCSELYAAKLSRVHNDSNVLAFGARVVSSKLTEMMTEAWLDAELESGRRGCRVNMIMEIENR